MRGGVPVFRRLVGNPARRRRPQAPSPALRRNGLRAGRRRRETSFRPETCRSRARRAARGTFAAGATTPRTAPPDDEVVDEAATIVSLGSTPQHLGPGCGYAGLSICWRSARTAGPLLSFRKRACRLHRSAKRPIAPPSASISRTSWPLALPPIDGLHGSVQIFSGSPVTSSVGTPKRADARPLRRRHVRRRRR